MKSENLIIGAMAGLFIMAMLGMILEDASRERMYMKTLEVYKLELERGVTNSKVKEMLSKLQE